MVLGFATAVDKAEFKVDESDADKAVADVNVLAYGVPVSQVTPTTPVWHMWKVSEMKKVSKVSSSDLSCPPSGHVSHRIVFRFTNEASLPYFVNQ